MKIKKLNIIISLCTLFVTPITTWFVVSYQLDKSQNFWVEQQKFLHEKETNKRIYDLYINCAKELSVLNLLIKKYHEVNSSKFQNLFFSQYSRYFPNINSEYHIKEHEILKQITYEIEDQIKSSISDLVAYHYLGSVYFGDDFADASSSSIGKLLSCKSKSLNYNDIKSIGDNCIKLEMSLEKTIEEFNIATKNNYDSLEIDKILNGFMSQMSNKIKEKNITM